jgi:hypothetical protein
MNDFSLLRTVPNITDKICFIGNKHERQPRIFPSLDILSPHSMGVGGSVAMPALSVGEWGGGGGRMTKGRKILALLECAGFTIATHSLFYQLI